MRDVLKDSLNSIEEIYNLMVQNEVSFGSKISFLNNLKNNLDNQKFVAEDEVTLLQQADVTQIAIDLSQREVLYQMSLSVAARLMSISLLDFME
ncbi:MAG: hypothetical protein A2173_07170 [Planctomycetes bacterium RBG_13_44_8b]|nr:MAG: hypothetical protein A2173_07170 [Planctomycetes bacterium RBG_13_44_8b]